MFVEILLAVVVAAVVLPVLLFAGLQRVASVSPRFGRWMDKRASRISPRVGRWFHDETRDT
ncbi:MAG: hypothetical protein WAU77_01180 [Solirubrobacteraceae bacterium]